MNKILKLTLCVASALLCVSLGINEIMAQDVYGKYKLSAADLKKQYDKEQKSLADADVNYAKSLKEEYIKSRTSYLIEDTSNHRIQGYEYYSFDAELCDLARNEIYARHGYIFTKSKYQQIFKNKTWYKPKVKDINAIKLTAAEQYNIMCLNWWKSVPHNDKLGVNGEGFTDCYKLPDGQVFSIDLNNDGVPEKIEYKIKVLEGNSKENYSSKDISIWINGKKLLEQTGFIDHYFYIVDVDSSDSYKELIIYDAGPSNDPQDFYYYYNGKKLCKMGTVEGHLNSSDYIKNKTLYSQKRSDILGTRESRVIYQLTSQHQWKLVTKGFVKTNTPIITSQKINVYKQASKSSAHKQYEVGTTFTAIGIDLKQWIKVQLKDGSIGYINANEIDSSVLGGVVYVD